jgi:carbon monoxide dehydrogenase subunit G
MWDEEAYKSKVNIIFEVIEEVMSKYRDVDVEEVDVDDLTITIRYKGIRATIHPYEKTIDIELEDSVNDDDVEYVEKVSIELLNNILNTLVILKILDLN